MTIPRSLSVAAKLGRASVAENTNVATPLSVGTINTFGASTATTYSLEGEYAGYFQLVRTGTATYEVALRAGVQLDYESLSFLSVTVRATSAMQPNHTGVTADFSLRITDTQDAPVIEGGDAATVQVAFGETAVTRVVATDQDSDALTYKIVGGSDRSLFQIDSATGELSFKQAPPSTGRTSFNVIVEAADKGTPASTLPIWLGGKPGTPPLTDKQAITVELFNPNGAPVFSEPSRTLTGSYESLVIEGAIEATDPNGDALTYSIVQNEDDDSDLFTITADGTLSFKEQEGRGSYQLAVEVSDGQATATQSITVELPYTVPELVRGPFDITETSFSFEVRDLDGDELTVWFNGQQEQVTRNEDGSMTLTVAPGQTGEWGDVTAFDGLNSVDVTYLVKLTDNADYSGIIVNGALIYEFAGLDDTTIYTNNNIVLGGTGPDYFNNFGSNNTLRGGIGDDYYNLTLAGDTSIVVEAPNEGFDTIRFYNSIDFTALDNVEHYYFTDSQRSTITFAGKDGVRTEQSVQIASAANVTIKLDNQTFDANTSSPLTITGFTAGEGGDRLILTDVAYEDLAFWEVNDLNSNGSLSVDGFKAAYVERFITPSVLDFSQLDSSEGSIREKLGNLMGVYASGWQEVIFLIQDGSGNVGVFETDFPADVELTNENIHLEHVATLIGVDISSLHGSNFFESQLV